MMAKRVFAVAAHPDDIEFQMAGTLILLAGAGYEIHMMNVGSGSCGTSVLPVDEIVAIRAKEARAAAELIGAVHHPPLVDDLEIFYERSLLAKLGAVMREVAPEILLVPSPDDYMEDHQNASRLAVGAAFCRGLLNHPTDPPTGPVHEPVTVYHAQPHGNRDALRRVVKPGQVVDISSVLDRKRTMLACHQSQKQWLDESQGMDSYIKTMESFAREVGALSGSFEYAEGWRRHLHYGFCGEADDPLSRVLGPNCTTLE